jgi:hypothetical protein
MCIYATTVHPPRQIPLASEEVRTWAFSDSNERTKVPCDAFLDASEQQHAWIVRTTEAIG